MFIAPGAGFLPGAAGEGLTSALDPDSFAQQGVREVAREVRNQAVAEVLGSVYFYGAKGGVELITNRIRQLENGSWVDAAGELLTGVIRGKRGPAIVVEEGVEVGTLVGQKHHAISLRVWKALEGHPTLHGKYAYRDPRFVALAKDKASHSGYFGWHPGVEKRVEDWLERNKGATPEEFEQYLNNVYSEPDLKGRFPGGLYSEAER
jgi:hypothetical protein